MTDERDPAEDEPTLDEETPEETAVEEAAAEPGVYAEPRPELPWRLTIFLVLAILVVVFAVQNTQTVELRFLAWNWQLPLVIIILVAVVVSVLLDEILGGILRRRRRRRRLEREELQRLRGDS